MNANLFDARIAHMNASYVLWALVQERDDLTVDEMSHHDDTTYYIMREDGSELSSEDVGTFRASIERDVAAMVAAGGFAPEAIRVGDDGTSIILCDLFIPEME